MNQINEWVAGLLPYTETAMLVLLLGGGLFLALYSRFKPYRYFRHAIDITRGKYDKEGATGEVSHLQALSAAIASTVGLGNISGVAIAVYLGGPGVIFWIWMVAILGMAIKYYSCSLAVMFRGVDSNGIAQGGPMYYMTRGLGKIGTPLAVFYALMGMIGYLAIFQANQFTQTFMVVVNPNETIFDLGSALAWKAIIGLVLAAITATVIFGGVQKIAQVATRVVGPMVGFYMIAVAIVLFMNASAIGPSFGLIFKEAFNLKTAVSGGLWGVIILGARRAMFSNEAGLGSAPMYHGQSKTDEPVQEGLVAMLGPFIDTIVVCTLTALVILISGAHLEAETNGILMTLIAFKKTLFGWGDVLLMIAVTSFALSTILTYSYYGVKSLSYLTNARIAKGFNYFYIITIVIAAVASVDLVINLMDLAYSLMLIPNMIAVLWLSPHVNRAAKDYFERYKTGRL
ncbi:MAG: alanine/glycine:cation symporter family protein [Bacteroidetes bacterium]|jgi:alanine or glycine:cation symporter, AGCS family|nr:alanine/glycine:cation symporter family protein [Bacteroidota bacterium]